MIHSLKHICEEFEIDEKDILNAYCYGSHVYGTASHFSDHDYILVHKKSFLSDGSFKQNAKSSSDRKIQVVNYSRSGFKNGIEYYEMSALECLFLPDKFKIQERLKYKLDRFDVHSFVKNTIAKSSNSWYSATKGGKGKSFLPKGVYHSIRILDFAIQIKNNKSIDFSTAKEIKKLVFTRDLHILDEKRKDLMTKLKDKNAVQKNAKWDQH